MNWHILGPANKPTIFFPERSFVTPQALWFSASGRHLMFVTFNDSSLSTVETLTYPRGGHSLRRTMHYPMVRIS